jgi:hypothetical protein
VAAHAVGDDEERASSAGSDGRTMRPESSLISRTQPLSVWTLASISKADGGGASVCRVSLATESDALFLPNMDDPLV